MANDTEQRCCCKQAISQLCDLCSPVRGRKAQTYAIWDISPTIRGAFDATAL
jgi:hypothetical protein